MDDPSRLTAMERAILERVAAENWPGYDVDRVRVERRKFTGVGKFVHLTPVPGSALPDGVDSAGKGALDMLGIRHSLFFSVLVKNGSPYYLEIATCGDESWDGAEREFRFLEMDDGETLRQPPRPPGAASS